MFFARCSAGTRLLHVMRDFLTCGIFKMRFFKRLKTRKRVASPPRSNCFFFALWMFITRGGYWSCRRSRHIWGLHWLWSRDGVHWIHFEPIKPQPLPKAIWHKLWYIGRIKHGDEDESDLLCTVYICRKCKKNTVHVPGKPKPTKCEWCYHSDKPILS